MQERKDNPSTAAYPLLDMGCVEQVITTKGGSVGVPDERKPLRFGTLLSDLILSALSLVTLIMAYSLSRIVIARTPSVVEFWAISYVLMVGTTVGSLFQLGKEQEALMEIPRMSKAEISRESKYLAKLTALFGLTFVLTVTGGSVPLAIDFRVWAILSLTLMSVYCQATGYTRQVLTPVP